MGRRRLRIPSHYVHKRPAASGRPRVNSVRAWLLGARPYSLPAAAAPVVVGVAWAWHEQGSVQLLPAVLCLLFALVMQVDANLINDYVDFLRGTDRPDRVGPSRMFAQGLITAPAMRRGIVLITVIGLLIGLPLIRYGGVELIVVGLLCAAACFLYSTYFSYRALGDVLVVLFFGLVPVYYTALCTSPPNAGRWVFPLALGLHSSLFTLHSSLPPVRPSAGALWLGLAMGLATDCLLLVNNHRDRRQDPLTGKRTLVVLLGARSGMVLYALCGLAAALIPVCIYWPTCVGMAIYLVLHLRTLRRLRSGEGTALNPLLGATSRNMLLFALLLAASLVLL